MINDCNEVIEQDVNPLYEILAEIEEAKDFIDEFKWNGIVSFFKSIVNSKPGKLLTF